MTYRSCISFLLRASLPVYFMVNPAFYALILEKRVLQITQQFWRCPVSHYLSTYLAACLPG